MLNIIDNFSRNDIAWHVNAMLRERGLDAFTDEMLEDLARRLLLAWELRKRMTAGNRRAMP